MSSNFGRKLRKSEPRKIKTAISLKRKKIKVQAFADEGRQDSQEHTFGVHSPFMMHKHVSEIFGIVENN